MKTKIKKQWTQVVAVAAAAVCAVTATFAGVNYQAAPMTVSALEAGTELTVKAVEFVSEETGEPGCNYEISLADLTAADAGETIYVTFVAAAYANQNLNGSGGYCDVDNAYAWTQLDQWNATADANGEYTVEFVTNETMIKYGTLQIQCWYPNGLKVDSCTAVFGEASTEETTTTTTTTTTASSEEDVTTTTTTEVSSEDEETTTTTTVSEEEETTTTTTTTTTKATTTTADAGKSISFTTGTQTGTAGDKQMYAEFDPDGAEYAVIVYEVSSSDDTSSGGVGTYNGEWVQVDFEEDVIDGKVTVTYQIPSDVGETVKAMVFYPSYSAVKFKSITLYYGDVPATTTASTPEYDSGLTFETITVGESNKLDMLDKCCLVATIKGPSNYSISGGVYHSDVKDEFKNEKTDSATNLLVKVFEVREEADCDFQIHWYANGATTEKTAPVHLVSYYEGDASLNGKVNGSDVRAIVNYLAGSTTDEVKEIVCDYDDSGSVKLLDAVTLTKALLGSSTTKALNS